MNERLTLENTRALIAEAEHLVRRSAEIAANPVAEFGVTKEIAFVRGVRWALSTLLPVPDGDARERIARALCEGADSVWDDLSEQERAWHYRDADSILAAFPVLSRDIAGEIEAEACDVPVLGDYKRGYQDGLARAAEFVRNGR